MLADDDGSGQTTFISVSLKSECSLRFAEPIVSHAVVDEADLRVDVDGVAGAPPRVERARERPPGAAGGSDEPPSMPAGVVGDRVRLRGKQ